ncbi:MAG: hypothetical protein GXO27_00520 [Chlorobi bacterium]|nr:hypothetical protein [Chlorobiota bacterium]
MKNNFVGVVTCMDGRIQKPVLEYIESHFPGVWPDTVTEPGPVKFLASERTALRYYNILSRLDISTEKHGARRLFIVAHPDCAGNPVPDEEQIRQLRAAKAHLAELYPGIPVHALWVENNRVVKEINEGVKE